MCWSFGFNGVARIRWSGSIYLLSGQIFLFPQISFPLCQKQIHKNYQNSLKYPQHPNFHSQNTLNSKQHAHYNFLYSHLTPNFNSLILKFSTPPNPQNRNYPFSITPPHPILSLFVICCCYKHENQLWISILHRRKIVQ